VQQLVRCWETHARVDTARPAPPITTAQLYLFARQPAPMLFVLFSIIHAWCGVQTYTYIYFLCILLSIIFYLSGVLK